MRRRSSPPARRQLREISTSAASTNNIFLLHVTAVGAARDIVECGQIDMSPCKVFSKDLTYFFVLRPAYRLKHGDAKSDEINRFPFVFVTSPENLGTPFHVYPFDTGGAAAGLFDARADEWVFLEDYELEPNLASAASHISWAFESTTDYLEGNLKPGLIQGTPQWQDVVRSFVNVAGLASSAHNKPDRRASAVEVAYRRNVPLKGNVKLVILPKQYLEHGTIRNTGFMDKLKAADVDWDTYDWQPNMAPDECRDQIFQIALKFFRKEGVV